MSRSTLLVIAVAGLAISATAQKTESATASANDALATTRPAQQVNLDDIDVKGHLGDPSSVVVDQDGSASPMVAIDLSRDFLAAVQGNVDREHIERQNGESR
ncbi:MAG TPA: hypothetical protein PKO15_10250 [Fibrobacteria bacterium]|nr:hypothetical protein [Fibrobacteria bacterium]HOX51042.1 hypothetical protein [Fibrobacteria bacterium]